MCKRIQKFESLKEHHWYQRLVKKLTQEEVEIIHQFCKTHQDKNALEFEYAGNRLYLCRPRTKNFAIVNELLTVIAYA